MINIALSTSIILGTGFLAYGYRLAGIHIFTNWFIALGLTWLVAQYNRWDWFSAAALIVITLAASLGLWMDLHAGWLIAGTILSLAAWDLTGFRSRTRTMPKDELRGMMGRHLARLSLIVLIGFVFATLLLLLRGKYTPDWGNLLLGVLAVTFVQFMVGLRTK